MVFSQHISKLYRVYFIINSKKNLRKKPNIFLRIIFFWLILRMCLCVCESACLLCLLLQFWCILLLYTFAYIMFDQCLQFGILYIFSRAKNFPKLQTNAKIFFSSANCYHFDYLTYSLGKFNYIFILYLLNNIILFSV